VTTNLASLAFAAPLLARRVTWELDLELLLRGAAKAVVIVVLAYVAWWAVRRLSRRIVLRAQAGDPATVGARAQRAATLAHVLNEVGLIVIVIVAGLLFLDIVINITPLLAGAGVLGVAASLGGQAVMKDIISGFLIVLEDQYAVGERVRIGDVEGTVQLLTLRSTVLRGDDGTVHYLSNGSLTSVANLSRRNVGRAVR
jgi:small-conductance mechanosensitive channel